MKKCVLIMVSLFAMRFAFAQEPLRVTPLDRVQPLTIPVGEYSGITHISGNRYAVVNDKSAGAGLWFFSIPISKEGLIGEVVCEQVTAPGDAASKDSEGITYLPSKGTVLVSTEADQSVREYRLDGTPTGRELAVPATFAKDKIKTNFGFEALTSSETTGLAWMTTEAPLKADEAAGIYRLQSFSLKNFKPAKEYRYRADKAEISASAGAKASAYVFSISALAALDDGRLLVMEREVYVPSGNMFRKLLSSFTHIKVYIVDPPRDNGEILQKTLLTHFYTSALDLANYEGMCLGPELPGGGRALVFIADSQSNRGGLVGEDIRIMRLR